MRHISEEKQETHDRKNRTTKIKKKSERSKKRKPKNTCEYWKLIPY